MARRRSVNKNWIIGILLIAMGILLLSGAGARDTAEIGPLRVVVTDRDDMRVGQILGALAVAGGIALIVWDSRGRRR